MKYSLSFSIASFLTLASLGSAHAQVKNHPYSFQNLQKFDEELYSPNTRYHTATKPMLFKGRLLEKLDSIQSLNPTTSDNWFMRKIFNEHLIQVEKED